METYLSGREDESPFRNSWDRISSFLAIDNIRKIRPFGFVLMPAFDH